MSTLHPHQLVITNQILNSLSRKEYPRLFASLRAAHLPRGKVLYELGERIDYNFFVLSGMISLFATTEEGGTTEISLIGNEGVAGVSALLGVNEAPYRMEVQIPGKVMRIRTTVLLEEFGRSGPLRDLMLRYTHSLILEISQSAACNRFHTIEQRLCRWLLVARDRVESNILDLTQDALSQMLGSNRTNVTAAASNLKSEGLIEYSRGRIQILDEDKLKKAACECYRTLLKEQAPGVFARSSNGVFF
jgi:CRP-like cAMP-binding protein